MTDAEWLSCNDPEKMLESLRGKASGRKLRLFAVACCRHLLRDVRVNPWDERAVDVAERYADGKADAAELEEAAAATTSDWTAAFACQEAASVGGGVDAAVYAADNAAWEAGEHAASLVEADNDSPAFAAAREAARVAQAALVRDIFGNPFRPSPPIDRTWLGSGGTVRRLAEAAYEERLLPSGHLDRVRFSVLADALEEAGCTEADLLDHLRLPGPHVRGCFVLDLLLGRE